MISIIVFIIGIVHSYDFVLNTNEIKVIFIKMYRFLINIWMVLNNMII